MRTRALLMALVMMTTALAGCTSGTDGVPEMDEDALNELIQDNLQDFINNTTIVVNNHYHNNTTIDNTDNSVSNVNGTQTDASMHVFTVTHDWDHFESLVLDTQLFIYDSQGNPKYAYHYNSQNITIHPTCAQVAMSYGNSWTASNGGYWQNYLVENFGYDGNNLLSVARDIFDEIGWVSSDQYNSHCTYQGTGLGGPTDLFEIGLSEGEVLRIVSVPSEVSIRWICDDGYDSSDSDTEVTSEYIGGHANCTVTGSEDYRWEIGSETSGDNNSFPDASIVPEQHSSPGGFFSYGVVKGNFVVYYEIMTAESVEHDLE